MTITRRNRFHARIAAFFLVRLRSLLEGSDSYHLMINHLRSISLGRIPRIIRSDVPDLADDRGLLPDDPVK